ncbi:MAG: TRAP transporter small permease subunit [Acetobacteraceae bacterium]|nr:TRAP transporter small permease subunit [Acetobacteraceae bacterium]
MRPLLRLADGIDAASAALGRAVKWLAVLLVVVQFAVVVLRYAFGTSYPWAQESVVYVHAFLFMLAIGYAYMLDAHVRVDFFWAGWPERRRALLEIAGVVLLLWPFCALVVWASWGYVHRSFALGEGPMTHGGLPFQPWLKALILAMAGLFALQGLSVIIRAAGVLAGLERTVFPRRQTVGEA